MKNSIECDDVIYRVSWTLIHDNKVLFLKSPKRDVYFDPGGRVEKVAEGETPEEKLTRHGYSLHRKIRRDLNILLKLSTLERLISFRTPAYKKPVGTMVEIHCYTSEYIGKLDLDGPPSAYISNMKFIDRTNPPELSPAGKVILQKLADEGHIY